MLQPTDRVLAKIMANAAADVGINSADPAKGVAYFVASVKKQTAGNPDLDKAVWELIAEVGEEQLAIVEGRAVPNEG